MYDRIAMYHDYQYLAGVPQSEADATMVSLLSKHTPVQIISPAAVISYLAFKAKDLYGYDPQVNTALAKEVAETPFFKEQVSMLGLETLKS